MRKPLTKNQLELMELLWREGPLSRTQMIEKSPDRSWKKSSIHILLNALIDEGYIEVVGFVKTGKNYGRTFTYTMTEVEYMANIVYQSIELNDRESVSSFIGAMVSKGNGIETVNLWEDAISEYKRELHDKTHK